MTSPPFCGGRNCWTRLKVNKRITESTFSDVTFTFTNINTIQIKKGAFAMTFDKCKVKSIVLTKKNLYFE